jgi:predicted ATPase
MPSRATLPVSASLLGGQAGVPVPLNPLVGRERELLLAHSLLRRPDLRLLTLTGPGGIGKTRLAIQLAKDLSDAFGSGARFIPLASIRDASLVATSIAHALGVQTAGRASTPDVIASALQDTSVLLVVDNFEHLLPAASLLTALLERCPGVKILVTSRVLLRVAGEHALAVPPLAVPDARSSSSFETLVQSSAKS